MIERCMIKVIKAILILLFAVFLLCGIFMIVASPMLWLSNLFNGDLNKDGFRDFREVIDEYVAVQHVAFNYEDFYACTMNYEDINGYMNCLVNLNDQGKYPEEFEVNLSMAQLYAEYNKLFLQYEGVIPDTAYEPILIPAKYQIMVRKEKTIESESGRSYTVWVDDHLEGKIYKGSDSCPASEPEKVCRLIEEEKVVYPYVIPAEECSHSSSRYGYRPNPLADDGSLDFHNGTDFVGGTGKIVSMSNGVVITAASAPSEGNYVEVAYDVHGFKFVAKYLHMASYCVTVGQEVEPGDEIGMMGATGAATGRHLHFGCYVEQGGRKYYFNPMILLGSIPD